MTKVKRKRGGNKLCICSHFGVANIRDNRNQHVFFAQMTPFTVHYDIIYHPFPINSQYFEDVGGWQPSPPREKWHISSCYLPLQSTAGKIFLQYCRLSDCYSMATVIKCLPSLPLYILLLLQKLVPKVGTTACLQPWSKRLGTLEEIRHKDALC